ncbi:MAG: hypothetical protein EOM06_00645 [Sphingobacteriia bacterium]|nr:hypothetical protein [Sphingobacteriia bacterium]
MILQDSVNFSGDYAGSAVCSNEGKFFIAGKHSGDLTACTISDFSVCWIYPIVPNPSQPYITCLQMIANQVYAGMWEGSIKRWTHSGIEGISTQLTSETFSTLLFATDNYLISSSQQKSNYQLYQIEVFYQGLGSLVNSVQSDILPIIFSQPATEEILILGNNQAGKACSRMFQPTTGMLSYPYQPFDLPAVPITAAAAVNPETILFATPEIVYLYEFEKSNIPLFHQQDVRQIRYEELSRTIWCSTGIKILVFDLNGNKQTEINTSFPAINFHFLYNR